MTARTYLYLHTSRYMEFMRAMYPPPPPDGPQDAQQRRSAPNAPADTWLPSCIGLVPRWTARARAVPLQLQDENAHLKERIGDLEAEKNHGLFADQVRRDAVHVRRLLANTGNPALCSSKKSLAELMDTFIALHNDLRVKYSVANQALDARAATDHSVGEAKVRK